MSGSLRLFRIEARRNFGLFLFLPFAAMVWCFVFLTTSDKVVLWPQVSIAVRDSVAVVGTAVTGVAAWMAGRGRRVRIEELLVTTAQPPVIRDLAAWATTTGWGLIGCMLGATIVLAHASLNATWGSPLVVPVVIGLLIAAASATWGYAAGTWFPGRFTAPLSAVVVFLFLFLPGAFSYPIQNLNFFSQSFDSVFFPVRTDLSPLHAAMLLGLTVLALGCIVLKRHRNLPAWGTALAGAAPSVACVVVLVGVGRPGTMSPLPYEPVCSQGSIEVCMHPAYQAVQAETVDVIERLTQPLVGVPGAPTKAVQVPSAAEWGLTPDGVLRFEPHESYAFLGGGPDSLASQISGVLTYGAACCDEAQEVIRGWLLEQAGVPIAICEEDRDEGGVCTGVPRRYVPHIERFAALPPEVRHAWLYDNYAALTRGELTLEDLP